MTNKKATVTRSTKKTYKHILEGQFYFVLNKLVIQNYLSPKPWARAQAAEPRTHSKKMITFIYSRVINSYY